ncbi:MAG: prolyl oligopeptidase family serine peptidase [Longimicrobiales bacterium]
MRFRTSSSAAVPATLALAIVLVGSCSEPSIPPPPETAKIPVYDTLHGVQVVDDYRWLEDQEAPETRAWIEAQNAYTDGFLDQVQGRDRIARRLSELMKVETMSAPLIRGGRYFFTKRSPDQDLSVIFMREGPEGEDRVLIDPNGWEGDVTRSAQMVEVSKDGTIMAYAIREGGQDEIELRFLDVDGGNELPDVLEKGRYFGGALTPDNRTLYYARHGDDGPRIYRHRMGTPQSADQMIFGDRYGLGEILFAQLSDDGRYLLITVLHGSAGFQELYLMDLARGGSVATVVEGIESNFSASFAGPHLVIQTDYEAPKGRVLVTSLARPGIADWREVIPESEHVMQGVAPSGGTLWVNYLEDVVGKIRIFDVEGNHLKDLEMPSLGTVGGGGEWDSDEAFYVFTSFHMPTTTYRYTVSTGESEVWFRPDIPFDSDLYEVEQVWYDSKDGTRVPMFLAHQKGLAQSGDNPTLLTGYGGFNIPMTPGFDPSMAVGLEYGAVIALPNLRGGSEFGEDWHRAGMFGNKQNVFDDFIAAAEWLIANDYTNSDKLAIYGGSNGGLLVGAAMTQRPDLYKAVVCTYPLLDMIRYHEFLVARYWVPEYGSSEDPEQFPYLLAYSPYHNVEVGAAYPATLFITGDGDTRVAPLHARKMAALVQAANGGPNPILLRYDTEAGHSGGMPVSKEIEDSTDLLSFLFWQLGVRVEGGPS